MFAFLVLVIVALIYLERHLSKALVRGLKYKASKEQITTIYAIRKSE